MTKPDPSGLTAATLPVPPEAVVVAFAPPAPVTDDVADPAESVVSIAAGAPGVDSPRTTTAESAAVNVSVQL
jgi:hypothetical protein